MLSRLSHSSPWFQGICCVCRLCTLTRLQWHHSSHINDNPICQSWMIMFLISCGVHKVPVFLHCGNLGWYSLQTALLSSHCKWVRLRRRTTFSSSCLSEHSLLSFICWNYIACVCDAFVAHEEFWNKRPCVLKVQIRRSKQHCKLSYPVVSLRDDACKLHVPRVKRYGHGLGG